MRALIALDLDEPEEDCSAVLANARGLLDRLGATIDLITVDRFFPPILQQTGEVQALIEASLLRRENAQRLRLTHLLGSFPADRRGVVEVARADGPADEITERATTRDLVVVGTHARRGLARVWLGSVAEKVVRSCPVPVLVARAQPSPVSDRALLAVDAWDSGSDVLVSEAARWAARLGLAVDLVHVITPLPTPDVGAMVFTEAWSTELFEHSKGAGARLKTLALGLPEAMRGTTRVGQGEPALQVVAAAQGYALTLIGTHGRRGLGRFWLGSVAERIARRAAGPVLVLRLPV